MSEKRFYLGNNDTTICDRSQGGSDGFNMLTIFKVVDLLNEQQELIEELQVSDEMGWKRAEHFEKKCPKELHNKKMYIKRLEYKVQKFKRDIEELGISIKLFEDDIATKDKKIEEQQSELGLLHCLISIMKEDKRFIKLIEDKRSELAFESYSENGYDEYSCLDTIREKLYE